MNEITVKQIICYINEIIKLVNSKYVTKDDIVDDLLYLRDKLENSELIK